MKAELKRYSKKFNPESLGRINEIAEVCNKELGASNRCFDQCSD